MSFRWGNDDIVHPGFSKSRNFITQLTALWEVTSTNTKGLSKYYEKSFSNEGTTHSSITLRRVIEHIFISSQSKINQMIKVYNGTPHSINVVNDSVFNPVIRKYTGGVVECSVPSNGMLNAKIYSVDLAKIEFDGDYHGVHLEHGVFPIPVFGKAFTGIDLLPEGYDVYIVSAMYASAARAAGENMDKIFTVADPVYTEDGNSFIGCRGICPAF